MIAAEPEITVKSTKELLTSLVMQQTLVEKTATINGLSMMPDNANIEGIFFGTGLSNPRELTKGIPFDFLIYPLIAAKIQQAVGGAHIHHLIADNHSLINRFSQKEVRKTAAGYRQRIEAIVDNLNIDNYHIYLSSEVATDKKYKALLEQVNDLNLSNQYAKYEAADIEYFHTTRDVLLKLGWKFSGKSRLDEASFDREHLAGFGNSVFPIYTACGKRFNDKKPNTVPYTLYTEDIAQRFVISKDEDFKAKVSLQVCSQQTISMLYNHYRAFIRLFEGAYQRLPASGYSTWEKLQLINQIITQ